MIQFHKMTVLSSYIKKIMCFALIVFRNGLSVVRDLLKRHFSTIATLDAGKLTPLIYHGTCGNI